MFSYIRNLFQTPFDVASDELNLYLKVKTIDSSEELDQILVLACQKGFDKVVDALLKKGTNPFALHTLPLGHIDGLATLDVHNPGPTWRPVSRTMITEVELELPEQVNCGFCENRLAFKSLAATSGKVYYEVNVQDIGEAKYFKEIFCAFGFCTQAYCKWGV